jgi:hypothetical protein
MKQGKSPIFYEITVGKLNTRKGLFYKLIGRIIMANGDTKAWNIANWIIIAMASIIGVLVVAGYSSLKSDNNAGFTALHARLGLIEGTVTSTNAEVRQMGKDITRIDTLQKTRLERDQREEYLKGKK